MDCQQCENLMTDYLEETLSLPVRRQFAEHLMACALCHHLYDDVRTSVQFCHSTNLVEPVGNLSDRILLMTTAGPMITCDVFDELISDYLDGFIAAADFHIFEAHFVSCSPCQRLISSVQAARDLFQEVEPVKMPAGLPQRILEATSGLDRDLQSLRPRWLQHWMHQLRLAVHPFYQPWLRTEYVTAVLLMLATMGLLLVEFSDDMTVPGLYRQARVHVHEQMARLSQFGVLPR